MVSFGFCYISRRGYVRLGFDWYKQCISSKGTSLTDDIPRIKQTYTFRFISFREHHALCLPLGDGLPPSLPSLFLPSFRRRAPQQVDAGLRTLLRDRHRLVGAVLGRLP